MGEACPLGRMDHANAESKDAKAKAAKARLHFGPGTACHHSFVLSGTKKSSLPALITNFEMLETRGK